MSKKITAIGLISGGLDSALAVRVIQEQGIEVIGLSCRHPFHPRAPEGEVSRPERVARELGIELVRPDVTDKMLELLKNPPHGYGRHLNPCIDCRIIYLDQGALLMAERDARFLITGEVLGQRPMSQRRDAMNIIDRDSSLRGLVLRPLCARLLKPTIPEEKGWVSRERLLDISGRSRKPQYELAESYGLHEFGSPGGGCLLTMEGFANKVRDLFKFEERLKREDVELLKVGRHFRLSPKTRLVVGKDDHDNRALESIAGDGDVVIRTVDLPGPLGLLRGEISAEMVATACALVGRYVSRAQGAVRFSVTQGGQQREMEILPLGRAEVEPYRLG